jgi:hypothetical protein
MSRLDDYLSRQRARYGEQFDDSSLSRKFARYFNSGQRIEVLFSYGEVKRGTVSATTGWRPSFMLMLTKRSIGSSWLLSDRDSVIAVIAGGKRISVASETRAEVK